MSTRTGVRNWQPLTHLPVEFASQSIQGRFSSLQACFDSSDIRVDRIGVTSWGGWEVSTRGLTNRRCHDGGGWVDANGNGGLKHLDGKCFYEALFAVVVFDQLECDPIVAAHLLESHLTDFVVHDRFAVRPEKQQMQLS
jgi:hypothetical protein